MSSSVFADAIGHHLDALRVSLLREYESALAALSPTSRPEQPPIGEFPRIDISRAAHQSRKTLLGMQAVGIAPSSRNAAEGCEPSHHSPFQPALHALTTPLEIPISPQRLGSCPEVGNSETAAPHSPGEPPTSTVGGSSPASGSHGRLASSQSLGSSFSVAVSSSSSFFGSGGPKGFKNFPSPLSCHKEVPEEVERGSHVFSLSKDWKEPSVNFQNDYTTRLNNKTMSRLARTQTDIAAMMRAEPGWAGCGDRFVVRPCSVKRLVWDTLSVIFLAHDVFAVPLLFFDFPGTTLTHAMSWILRIFWTLDIVASLITGYFRPDGEPDLRLGAAAKRYAKSWLGPDLLIVLGDWLQEVASSAFSNASKATRTSRILRLFRLFRLFRVAKVPKLIEIVSEKVQSESVGVACGVVGRMIAVFSLAHVLGCAWFALGSASADGWVCQTGLSADPRWYLYATSLHWSTTQFTGSMEVQAHTLPERIFSVCVLLFAFVVAAVFISSITSSLTRLCILTHGQAAQFATLRRFLLTHGIHPKLISRVVSNAQFALAEKQRLVPESEVEILTLVSEPLRAELRFEMYSPTLSVHPLFRRHQNECPEAARKLCHRGVSPITFSRGDVLFSAGELPATKVMLFLRSGRLAYQHIFRGREDVVAGEWVSESVLWTDWQFYGSLQSMQESSLLAVDGAALANAEATCPTYGFTLRTYAVEYVQELNKSNLSGSVPSDVGMAMDSEALVHHCYGRPSGPQHTTSLLWGALQSGPPRLSTISASLQSGMAASLQGNLVKPDSFDPVVTPSGK